MKFDFEGARKAGVSDEQILEYLSNIPSNADINGIKKLGVNPSDIVNLLSNSKEFQINMEPPRAPNQTPSEQAGQTQAQPVQPQNQPQAMQEQAKSDLV